MGARLGRASRLQHIPGRRAPRTSCAHEGHIRRIPRSRRRPCQRHTAGADRRTQTKVADERGMVEIEAQCFVPGHTARVRFIFKARQTQQVAVALAPARILDLRRARVASPDQARRLLGACSALHR